MLVSLAVPRHIWKTISPLIDYTQGNSLQVQAEATTTTSITIKTLGERVEAITA